jgi:para-nitrobenzyl esterase
MGGNVQDEGNFGIGITEYFSGPPQVPITAAQYTANVASAYSPPAYPAGTAAKILAKYPLTNYATPQLAYDAVTTAPTACRNLHVAGLLAQRVPTYAYTFNYRNAPYYFPAMPGFQPLAAHTIDIQFLFPGYHGGSLGVNRDQTTGRPRELNGPETKLSNKLVSAWTNFALTGNPNRAGNSPWPQHTSIAGAQSVLDENVPSLSALTTAQTSAMYQCGFWNTILTY